MSDSEDLEDLEDLEDTSYVDLSDEEKEKKNKKPQSKKSPTKKTTKVKDSTTKEKRTTKKSSEKSSEKSSTKKSSSKKSSTKKSSSKSSSKAPSDDEDAIILNPKSNKSIEERFQKLEQVEHVLKRPDLYVGSCKMQTENLWVMDEGPKMTYRSVTYVPALFKIFDEIIVNAADNKQRSDEEGTKMHSIKVNIDVETGWITVVNDGIGIPVEEHKIHKMYVPCLIFGEMLAGENFDDSVKRIVGGRNGLGAKLTNIYSTEFIVDLVDKGTGKHFTQTFKNNMSIKEKPKIKPSSKLSYTKIMFKPDLERFGMSTLDDDILALFRKRVWDIAGCHPSLKVELNDTVLPVKNFQDYCKLYLADESVPLISEKNERWEIAFTVSETGEFRHISFVNCISTPKGGTHVKYVSDKIVKELREAASKKNKGAKIQPNQIKTHMCIFIKSFIENPEFNSQTKEELITLAREYGSTLELTENFMKKVKKSGIIDLILQAALERADTNLSKIVRGTRNKRLQIAKLDDANEAGGKNSDQCTLILTEGDSAKSLAVSGLGVVGRDYYGVFPLRGKLLNVREAPFDKIINNEELKQLIRILGIKRGHQYTSTKELRYGHVMIMTDQDHDGSHIKGLIINFLSYFSPSLLKIPGFLNEFITPIVKAKRGSQEVSFYSVPEYEKWKEKNIQDDHSDWKIKYYKGLGTSSSTEAKEYFKDLDKHQIDFNEATSEDNLMIELAFDKKKADARKEWMKNYESGTYLDHNVDSIDIKDFINKELILFSMADCVRSIPNVMDGLKSGQRKILFVCFKRKLKNEIKVAQLAGSVAELSAYHHGEISLMNTIINLAQNYVGSNNINLLYPSGQFGTRLQGGKDAASPRYIFTRLSNLTRLIFHPDDDHILNYLDDDGAPIEPEWYVPIIPMCLVNGAEGIGTGWSTEIPNYNPLDIVENLKKKLNGEDFTPMHPWYRGFKGTIEWDASKKNYVTKGVYKRLGDDNLEVTELPIGTWTNSYKEYLISLINGTTESVNAVGKKKKEKSPIIRDFREYHTDTTVHFVIEFLPGELEKLISENKLEKELKLTSTKSISNKHLFNSKNQIEKYETAEAILQEFFNVRLEFYKKRKAFFLDKFKEEKSKLENKVRFILDVIAQKIIIRNRKRAEIINELKERKFTQFYDKKDQKKTKKVEDEEDSEDEESSKATASEKKSGYEYLLGMPLWSLTMERVNQLKKQLENKHSELLELEGTSIETLWTRDLDAFCNGLKKWYAEEEEIAKASSSIKVQSGKAKRRGPRPKKRKNEEDDEDYEVKSKAPKRTSATSKSSSTKKVSKMEIEDEELEKPTRPAKTAKVGTSTAESKKVTTSTKPSSSTSSKSSTLFDFFKKTPQSSSVSVVSDDEEEEEDNFVNLLKKNPSKPQPKKSAKVIEDSDEEMEDYKESGDEKSSKKKSTTTAKSASKPPPKKSKEESEEEESEEEEESYEESDEDYN